MSDRKDSHNLVRESIALRVVQIPNDIITSYNNNQLFDLLDLESDDVKKVENARSVIRKMMKYINNICDISLERNITTKNYKSTSSSTGTSSAKESIFSKNKKIKLSYN